MSSQALEYESEYRSSIGPRTAVGRSSMGRSLGSTTPTGGGRILKIVTEMGSSVVPGMSPEMAANAGQSFLAATEREKKEMQSLNERLGNYIDRVKGLEAQNRKLVADLDELRGRWGKDTWQVKEKYTVDLSSARKGMDDATRQKAELEVRISRLQEDINEYRRRFEDALRLRSDDEELLIRLKTQIADAEAEIESLRQRWKQLNDEITRLSNDQKRLWDELRKARNDLDQETIARIDYQNQVQTLLEELEFLRRVHDQEVKELQALLQREPADTRDFFKNELALAIRDIRGEYDIIQQQNKQDMESWYRMKVQEVQGAAARTDVESNYQREETKRIRDNIGDLRGKLTDLESKNMMLEKQVKELTYQLEDDQRQYEAALNDRDAQLRKMREECQALVAELQALLDTKQILDAEIAIYRKMLESEENRAGIRQMVEQAVKSHSLQQQEDTESQRHVRGEMSTRTTFQRSAKGNVTISECDPDGKFIILENSHRNKDEDISGWKLKRKIDGKREIVYTVPHNVLVKPGRAVKIWAREQGGFHNPPYDFIFDGESSWGTGNHVQTVLVNKDSEEKATHTQRTVQNA